MTIINYLILIMNLNYQLQQMLSLVVFLVKILVLLVKGKDLILCVRMMGKRGQKNYLQRRIEENSIIG